MQTSRVVAYNLNSGGKTVINGGGNSYRFAVSAADPMVTSAVLGTACAAMMGLAFVGGVPLVGAAAPTSANVQGEFKAAPILKRAVRTDVDSENSGENEVPISQWRQDIEWIRFHSDVSVSALANVFDVTRKAFYGWMSGEVVPRSHRIARVSTLRSALELLSTREERSALFGLLDRRTASGDTLRELLASSSEEENALGRMSDVIKELDPHIQRAAERARRGVAKSRVFEADFPTA